MDNLSQDLTSGALDQADPGMTRLRWLAAALLALLFVSWLIVGCMTVNIDHVVLTDHSNITVSQPKTVTTTTDASIPAGALGL